MFCRQVSCVSSHWVRLDKSCCLGFIWYFLLLNWYSERDLSTHARTLMVIAKIWQGFFFFFMFYWSGACLSAGGCHPHRHDKVALFCTELWGGPLWSHWGMVCVDFTLLLSTGACKRVEGMCLPVAGCWSPGTLLRLECWPCSWWTG